MPNQAQSVWLRIFCNKLVPIPCFNQYKGQIKGRALYFWKNLALLHHLYGYTPYCLALQVSQGMAMAFYPPSWQPAGLKRVWLVHTLPNLLLIQLAATAAHPLLSSWVPQGCMFSTHETPAELHMNKGSI